MERGCRGNNSINRQWRIKVSRLFANGIYNSLSMRRVLSDAGCIMEPLSWKARVLNVF
jgi:hypothetical protein